MLNAIHKADATAISRNAKQYVQKGSVLFDKVQMIPLASRIPNLTHVYGMETIHKMMAAMLTSFNNDLNLIRPMNASQIGACSLELVMTSEEDQLSIEDYVLFFKGAMEGKYGRILDRMDQQTVFSLLEEYREQRWQALRAYRENEAAYHKSLGPTERTNERNEIAEQMGRIGDRLNTLKEKLKEQRDINRMKKFQKDL